MKFNIGDRVYAPRDLDFVGEVIARRDNNHFPGEVEYQIRQDNNKLEWVSPEEIAPSNRKRRQKADGTGYEVATIIEVTTEDGTIKFLGHAIKVTDTKELAKKFSESEAKEL